MTGILPSIWAMDCWSTSAIPLAHEDDAAARRAGRVGDCCRPYNRVPLCCERDRVSERRPVTPPSPHRHSHRVSRRRRDRQQREARDAGAGRDAEHCRAHPRASQARYSGISAATYRLVEGLFECEDRGPQTLKGVSTPLTLYRVIGESTAQSRFEVAVRSRPDAAGRARADELGLLQRALGASERRAKARWCCSAASRALANHAGARR